MIESEVIRAWKDPLYRASLSSEEKAALPVHPSGLIELPEADLKLVSGGGPLTTVIGCTEFTFRNRRECCP